MYRRFFTAKISFAAIAVFLLSAGFAYAAPSISSISPTSKNVGSTQFSMTVNGSNFNSGSVVRFNGSNRTTTYVNSGKVTAIIPASDMTTAATNNITVFNATGSTGTSGSKTFTVNNLVPTTTGLSQTSAMVGDLGFTISVTGTNFINTSVVKFAGASRTTTYISSTQLDATILTSDLATVGTFAITVVNPTPGGGTSGSQTFTVNNPVPTTTTISPLAKNAGSGAFTLTVNGTNFVSGATVDFDGSARTTTFVNSTKVTASITSSDVFFGQEGYHDITVVNPSPGGGASNAASFDVVSLLAPTITDIVPSSSTYGNNGFTLTVNGSRFFSGGTSTIYWGSLALPTTYVSSGQLTASLASVPAAGIYYITVVNTIVFGGSSNPVAFTVYNAPPTATALSVSSNSCPIAEDAGLATFSWNYQDLDGDNQNSFQIQIDNNADFSSPAVDRTFSGLSNAPGSQNNQAVNIVVGGNGVDSLLYNTLYHWRVKVCQVDVDPALMSTSPLCSAWTNGTNYTTIAHPGPFTDFSTSNTSPGVTFTNNTVCYNVSGQTACKSYLYDFGDGSTFMVTNPALSPTATIHTYPAIASYNATITATDNDNLQCSLENTVAVVNPVSASLPIWKETNPFTFSPICIASGAACTLNADCCSGVCVGGLGVNKYWLGCTNCGGGGKGICQ